MSSNKDDFVVWLEVHSADSLHVDSVLGKLESLLAFLERHAKELKRMRSQFVWLATGRVYLPPDGRERRRLNARGLLLKSKRLDLNSL